MRVAIGPIFDEFGGVTRYIHNIKKFSSNPVSILPHDLTRPYLYNRPNRIDTYKKVINFFKLRNYNTVHSNADPWFVNLCADSRAYMDRWVHTYHALFFEEDYPDGLSLEQKRINATLIDVASKADVRITISRWLHDYLLQKYSINTTIIPNGVDVSLCDTAKSSAFYTKYSSDGFILYLGYINNVKNPRLFIELAKHLPEKKFLMAGRGLDESNLKNNLNIELPNNLITMGEISHEDALNAIAACRLFIMTSHREGMPTALLEAMCMRKAVVVPNHSGCKEVVENTSYGYLYEPNSLDDLVKNVKLALKSDESVESAREKILKNYDWKVLIRDIDSVYSNTH